MPPTAGGRLRVSVRTGRRTRRPRARRVRPTIVRSRDPAQAVQATDQRGTRLAFMPIVRPGQATAVRLGTTLRRGLQRLTVGAPPSRRNGVRAGRHTRTAVTTSSLLIRREPILHRAAAIRRRLVPTLRLAAATAPVAEAATVDTVAVMVEGEAAMVAGAATMAVMAVGEVIAVVEVITAGAVGAVGAVITVVEGVAAHTGVVAVVAAAGYRANSGF